MEWEEGVFGETDPEKEGPHYMVAAGLALRKGGE
jgi:hypothetical protein